MKNRFVSFLELLKYFEKDTLKADITNSLVIGLSSVSDFLYLSETAKKDNKKYFDIQQRYLAFQKNPNALGQILVAELSREQLEAAIFNDTEEVTELWENATNVRIEPRHSISYLALRNTSYTWWDENVLEEMILEYGLH